MSRVITLIAILLGCMTSAVFAQNYTFSIVPQQSASRLAKQWNPIMQALSKHTGHEFIFTTATNIPTFEERLQKGEYSFAYMNPYHFVVFNKSPGYLALAKAKDKKIKGIIVVRKDSGITKLEQLNNEQLAFPSPAAFAASILPQAHLKDNNVIYTPKYVSSHDSVYLSVSKGFFRAGGGVMRTFNAMDPKVKAQLNPIWTTNGFTPHAIAAHPSVSAELRTQVQSFFAELANTLEGKALLDPLKIKGFTKANSQDWDDVRALDINLIATK